MTSSTWGAVSFAFLAATGAACSPANPPPKTPDAVAVATNTPIAKRSDQQINLSSDIRSRCEIDDSDRAPKFDFDSTQLASNDRDILQAVGRCFTTGPLKGRALRLVGRADPRGETEYNMNLGSARATSVERYLAQLGVSNAKMSETSRGALDAMGHDEDSWRKDRRVDVSLVP